MDRVFDKYVQEQRLRVEAKALEYEDSGVFWEICDERFGEVAWQELRKRISTSPSFPREPVPDSL
eukprot:3986758-Lingulodinium_polyedra.AAC.1